MDKILLGAYLSVLAAFITAAASIVKLVNEKESKTTDYRQSWTDSVRSAMSQLIASISLQAGYLYSRSDLVHKVAKIHSEKAKPGQEKEKESVSSFLKESLTEINTLIRENRQHIHKNYALTTLHFKPNDEIYSRIEQKYEIIENLFESLTKAKEPEKEAERVAIKEKITASVNDLTNIARHILKTEWEHVKAGEPAYRKTKIWSQSIGIATFSILVICGIYMLAYVQIQKTRESLPTPKALENNAQAAIFPNEIKQVVNIEPGVCPKSAAHSGSVRVTANKPCNIAGQLPSAPHLK